MNVSHLNIVPVESPSPHDQQVSLGVRRTEPLFAEGQEGAASGQVKQRRYSVRHPIRFLAEKD